MNQLHKEPIWLPTTGTSATAPLHKGLRGICVGTRSGTQAEQFNSFIGVPTSQVEQRKPLLGAGLRRVVPVFRFCPPQLA